MAGMIQDQMQAPADAGAAPVDDTQDDATENQGDITPDSIMAKLHLTPQQKPQLQRIVVAGMKVMFDQQSHHLMLDALNGPGPLPQKLGQGIAGLMGMLVQESKNSLPPDLIIPAALVLLAHAADFMNKSGMTISNQDIGAAIDVCVSTILQAYKLDPAKVQSIAGDAGADAGADADQQPPQQQQAPAAPQGVQ